MEEYNSTYETNYLTFNAYLTKVFSTMAMGLVISTLCAFFFSQTLIFTPFRSSLMLVSVLLVLVLPFISRQD